ncbi:ScyD/ScyE family protein [Herbiconiux daphne]|uniref:ScyD/ScyE family protein n=1 Tax=Herbiconiux daphne TaxID=2970914 RepID=A0ABT2H7K7_9MICO|nr:ScyD/ScyE family protein [Herbiconiux daphne]MCS5735882.1 ScyD/ScyE family protein [Herbiconiux daphne]
MNKRTIVGAALAAAFATVAIASPASAWHHSAPEAPDLSLDPVQTLATDLVSPLSLDVDRDGNVAVSQNFIGQLTGVGADGTIAPLASATVPGQEIGAVSSRHSTVFYAQNDQAAGVAQLMALQQGGEPQLLADLGAYEATVNPDQVNTYGFSDLDPACAALIDPAGPAGPPTYTGIVDSHPYGSLALRDAVYVADAGGNDILRVGYDGEISTAAVLPPGEPVVVTPETAAMFGFPECTVGHGYSFEPVPTDVERGPDGWLYVSSLPGGPEDPSLGLRGSVYKVDPWSGDVELVATGFGGATGLAVDRATGVVLVAELFGGPEGTGQISALSSWSGEVFATFAVSSPAAIELRDGHVYATTDAFVPDAEGNPQPIGTVTVFQLTNQSDGSCWGDDGEHEEEAAP